MRPTRSELLAAVDRKVPDVIGPGLRVLFCGINPGLYSAFTGHHFARPGNRFWPALHAAGFTERLLAPSEERELLGLGYGITNLVSRASVSADEVGKDELVAGAAALRRKVKRHEPRIVAILGVGAYRAAFGRKEDGIGPQRETLGPSTLWVLPNPSGLNAHYTPTALAALFRKLRLHID